MFPWKKEEKPKRRSSKNLSQFGLFDISGDVDPITDTKSDDDDDFEAELAAITAAGGPPKAAPRKKPKNLVSSEVLDKLVADSLRDIPSDEELNSGDEDDPSLLEELKELSGEAPDKSVETPTAKRKENKLGKLLNERLKMYQTAEENAKQTGETSRARRIARGIKTLNDLIKSVAAGKTIDEADIPPEVAPTVTKKVVSDPSTVISNPVTPDPSPVIPDPSPVTPDVTILSPEQKNTINLLNERKKQYQLAALKAKNEDDKMAALKCIKIAKQFDVIIDAIQNGQPVDLSNMPGPPENAPGPTKEENETQKSSQVDTNPVVEPNPIADEPKAELITASSLAEALQQRLEIYKAEEQKAKDTGNGSKARRMGRIVKQFQDAIKLNNAGKPVPIDELPTPPGLAPIPVPGGTPSIPPPASPQLRPAPAPPTPATTTQPTPSRPAPEIPPDDEKSARRGTIRRSGNQSSTTVNERQLEVLLAKQKEFKLAALKAKKNGEIMQAKEYLKMAKGIEPLIDAATCGLPVDMSSIPVSANARSQLEEGFDFVMTADCNDDDSEMSDILGRMEDQLVKQLKLCFSTRDHLKAIGDIAGMNRFENLALDVTRDLDLVRVARRSSHKMEPPKFHYETKKFSVVKCNTDLNDDELELKVVRGINYKCSNPDDIDTYVKFEFPYPQEDPYRDRTALIKNTNNPEYNASFKIPIQRSVRNCQRVFKRQSVKFEVYSKGGFFKGDTLLGMTAVKLQPLETKVEIHDSFDLMEGRKQVGGKLEVHLKIRDPLQTRQIEELSERWLKIDS